MHEGRTAATSIAEAAVDGGSTAATSIGGAAVVGERAASTGRTTTAILWTGFFSEIRRGRTVAAQMEHAGLDLPARQAIN